MLYTGSSAAGGPSRKAFTAARKTPRSRILLQELLRLVNLGGKVGAAAAVGMVEKHHGPVGLADLFLRDRPLTVRRKIGQPSRYPPSALSFPSPPSANIASHTILPGHTAPWGRGPRGGRGETYFRARIKLASFLFILVSNPPL